jgi:hypothetical protein
MRRDMLFESGFGNAAASTRTMVLQQRHVPCTLLGILRGRRKSGETRSLHGREELKPGRCRRGIAPPVRSTDARGPAEPRGLFRAARNPSPPAYVAACLSWCGNASDMTTDITPMISTGCVYCGVDARAFGSLMLHRTLFWPEHGPDFKRELKGRRPPPRFEQQ